MSDSSENTNDRTAADGARGDGLAALQERLGDLDEWRFIGEGGFAVVYAARQQRLGRHVAVKLLRERPNEAVVRRFLRECEVMGGLSSHPHIVTIHDAGVTDDGRPYLVMEHLPGGTLADRSAKGTAMPWRDVVSIGAQVADGLSAAHERGILHLDIKPANVMISSYGAPKLGDFGIARLETSGATTSVVPFSPFYVAPETIDGKQPTRATDVYALGATLATLLRGHPPFWRPDDNAVSSVITRTVNGPSPTFDDIDAPEEVRRVLARTLVHDPVARPTVDALRDELAGGAQPINVAITAAPSAPATMSDSSSAESSSAAASSASSASAHVVIEDRRQPHRGGALVGAAVAALAAVAIAIGVFAATRKHSPSTAGPAVSAKTTTAANDSGTPSATVASTAARPVAATSAPSTSVQPAAASAPRTTTVIPTVNVTFDTPTIALGTDPFPPVSGGKWSDRIADPTYLRAEKQLDHVRSPPTGVKHEEARTLFMQDNTGQYDFIRFELDDALLSAAAFRQQFVSEVLQESDFIETPVASTTLFVSSSKVYHRVVFLGGDHAGWTVFALTTDEAVKGATILLSLVGGAPI